MCPAVIFAASLTPNDNALTAFDIISSVTIKGANGKGLPFGMKALKKFCLWLKKPNNTEPIHILILKPNAIAICAVGENV
jgi:hypothetical protein